MAFQGWIIKFGDQEFPIHYIAPSSYTVVPEKRTILAEYLDMENTMHYEIHPSRKTVVEFTTKMGLHLKDVEKIQEVIRAGMVNEIESRYTVRVWNPYTLSYKTMEAKLDDIKYPMRKVDPNNKDILYDEIRIKLQEY